VTVAVTFAVWNPGAVTASEYVPTVTGVPPGQVQRTAPLLASHDIVTVTGPDRVATASLTTPASGAEIVKTIPT
jgi:hypothetical protein